VLRRPESIPPRFVSFAWRYRGCARSFAPTGCGRPLLWAWTIGLPEPSRDSTAEISGFSQVPGRPPCVHALGGYPGGPPTPSHPAPEILPSVHPTTSAPRCGLSRLVTTACTLAVYASWRGLLLPPRKTRFRWVANPCRVGFGPTGSTTKGFGFCLLHVPSSLPRLRLAQGASPGKAWTIL
jgi:hypothetical protein